MTPALPGIYTPIATPFRNDVLDEAALTRNVARYMRTKLSGLVVLGSTGEAVLLDDDEADRAIATVRHAMPADRPLIAGTGRESTRATIAATARAAAQGATAVLVRTPSFFKNVMTADRFVDFYRAVADASPVPVLLYNVSMYTGVILPADAVAALAAHPNVVGMKESGNDPTLLGDYIASSRGHEFFVLAGSGAANHAGLAVGARGAILALAGIVPNLCVELWDHVARGRFVEARDLQRALAPLARTVGGQHGVPALKAALHLSASTAAPRVRRWRRARRRSSRCCASSSSRWKCRPPPWRGSGARRRDGPRVSGPLAACAGPRREDSPSPTASASSGLRNHRGRSDGTSGPRRRGIPVANATDHGTPVIGRGPTMPTRLALPLFAVVLCAACATNPVSGKKQISLLSEAEELAIGQPAGRRDSARDGRLRRSRPAALRVDIGQRLARSPIGPNLPWTFTIVDSPAINAFALPGGYVYMTRGFSPTSTTKSEFAGVLGSRDRPRHRAPCGEAYTRQAEAQLGLTHPQHLCARRAAFAGLARRARRAVPRNTAAKREAKRIAWASSTRSGPVGIRRPCRDSCRRSRAWTR